MIAASGYIDAPLVRVQDLTVRFVNRDMNVPVVNGVSFALKEGEVLCLLGESGSGKSVTMRALMRLLPDSARLGGQVTVGGHDILALPRRRLPDIRGALISMIFQEPLTALDPVYTVGQQIAETVRRHDGVSKRDAMRRALELLELVQIPSAARRLAAYPHELSGGLRQRAMIALALSCRPRLLLADEPTTALDATVQIQVLLLLRELQRELGMATIFVTHDLGVACEVADKVAVMYAGRFVETGTIADVMDQPRHPYTQGLLRSTVHAGMRDSDLLPIPGAPPDLAALPPGCCFAPRCPMHQPECDAGVPVLREPLRMEGGRLAMPGSGHAARCIRIGAENPRLEAAGW
ncbi:ABC transporter ATP-binding protein [Bordetella bronchialis]|uniref:Dipeptide ABC transporter ATP-binding protein DppD n=1 Tax=Bordetella bronchialis TaxID=463025 RepID=A0A193FNA0_9BORD|nr:ABC transporter ATP-binding protein [Bordetella bronchialis]ANN68651.1 dipeptide ABC transporter ATP-binding protein DppD [Bordetella bronchialis]ANN73791.1 dipeptide ABC transporter ATP-binding protein DppD [Bordetella bronchialis]